MSKRYTPLQIGGKYNMLTILAECPKHGKGHWYLCLCDCGNICILRGDHIASGRSKSCGCLIDMVFDDYRSTHTPQKKHGFYGTPIYKVWSGIIERCTNPKNTSYFKYGGRGITICDEWKDANTFCTWALSHGYQHGLTIDRINNDKGYCPENCRWTDIITQANNTRRNVFYEVDGMRMTRTQWARHINMDYEKLRWIDRKGGNVEQYIRSKLPATAMPEPAQKTVC